VLLTLPRSALSPGPACGNVTRGSGSSTPGPNASREPLADRTSLWPGDSGTARAGSPAEGTPLGTEFHQTLAAMAPDEATGNSGGSPLRRRRCRWRSTRTPGGLRPSVRPVPALDDPPGLADESPAVGDDCRLVLRDHAMPHRDPFGRGVGRREPRVGDIHQPGDAEDHRTSQAEVTHQPAQSGPRGHAETSEHQHGEHSPHVLPGQDGLPPRRRWQVADVTHPGDRSEDALSALPLLGRNLQGDAPVIEAPQFRREAGAA
jgi:hypothetical protein